MSDVVGVPQTSYVQDAARQASFTQAFFYTLGDIFSGTDSSPRLPSSTDPGIDVAVDAAGNPYIRGTTTDLGRGPVIGTNADVTGSTIKDDASAAAGGFVVTPGMVLAGLVALFLVSRKK